MQARRAPVQLAVVLTKASPAPHRGHRDALRMLRVSPWPSGTQQQLRRMCRLGARRRRAVSCLERDARCRGPPLQCGQAPKRTLLAPRPHSLPQHSWPRPRHITSTVSTTSIFVAFRGRLPSRRIANLNTPSPAATAYPPARARTCRSHTTRPTCVTAALSPHEM